MGLGTKSGVYGKDFYSVYEFENIKFVKPTKVNTTAPRLTQTPGRVYVTLDTENELKFISFYDKENKRYKTIDLDHRHTIDGTPEKPHVHLGYNHDENGSRALDDSEKEFVEMVKKIWNNRSQG